MTEGSCARGDQQTEEVRPGALLLVDSDGILRRGKKRSSVRDREWREEQAMAAMTARITSSTSCKIVRE